MNSDPPQTPLERRAGQGADAPALADAAVLIWLDIEAVLAPIVGSRGVLALFRRVTHMERTGFPWLVELHEPGADHFAELRNLLARQDALAAAQANRALLASFYGLLTNLIGASLTGRLLGFLTEHISSDTAMQDVQS